MAVHAVGVPHRPVAVVAVVPLPVFVVVGGVIVAVGRPGVSVAPRAGVTCVDCAVTGAIGLRTGPAPPLRVVVAAVGPGDDPWPEEIDHGAAEAGSAAGS